MTTKVNVACHFGWSLLPCHVQGRNQSTLSVVFLQEPCGLAEKWLYPWLRDPREAELFLAELGIVRLFSAPALVGGRCSMQRFFAWSQSGGSGYSRQVRWIHSRHLARKLRSATCSMFPCVGLTTMVGTVLHANLRPFALTIVISFSVYLRPSELLTLQPTELVSPQPCVDPNSGTGAFSCVRPSAAFPAGLGPSTNQWFWFWCPESPKSEPLATINA